MLFVLLCLWEQVFHLFPSIQVFPKYCKLIILLLVTNGLPDVMCHNVL